MNAQYYIEKLELQQHPEGGYYKETYRCSDQIQPNFSKELRSVSTAIYFLLQEKEVSHFHKIKSDELWFFHAGSTLEILALENGEIKHYLLGDNIDSGESFQVRIPANTWFASRIKNQTGFSLVSCTVAPGFDFRDFELADKTTMNNEFPHYREYWELLCLP